MNASRVPAEGGGASPGAPRGEPRSIVVVTGLSGAGKSQVLHTLEDLGFFCVDNLPTLLAPQAVELCERGGMTRVALGIDVRVRAFLGEVGSVLELLEAGRDLHVLFLDANDETILRRFSETRRPHPLSAQAQGENAGAGRANVALAVLDGVSLERERLAPLRARATRVIDTTNTSVHELRRILVAQFGPSSPGAPSMVTRILSFGFKFGPPVDADIVLDVRFLDNPYFVPELKPLSGLDEPVAEYVLSRPETQEFLRRTNSLLGYVMPRYEREGKSYLTIAVGCTGGRHRSVTIAETLARDLAASAEAKIAVIHRDVHRADRTASGDAAPAVRPAGAPEPAGEGREDRSSQMELKGAISAPPARTSTGGKT